MKTVAKNLVALGVLAAVGAGVAGYAYWRSGEEQDAATQSGKKPLFEVERTDVVRLTMVKQKNEVVVERGPTGWEIVKPVRMAANPDKVEAVARRLSSLVAEKRFGEEGQPDAPADTLTGLDAPADVLRAEVKRSDQPRPHEIVVEMGKDSDFDQNTWARTRAGGEAKVVALAPSARDDLVMPWSDLVERRLLGVDVGDVMKLQVVPGNPGADRVAWTAERVQRAGGVLGQGPEFKIVEPFEGPADDNAVRSALEGLAATPVATFVVEDRGAQLQPWGLDQPEWIVTATVKPQGEGPTVERTIRIGPAKEDGKHLVVRDDQPWVGEVHGAVDKGLAQTLEALKSKDVFLFEREAVARVEMDLPAGRITIERGETRASDWRMLSPEPGTVKAYVANGLVFSFVELKGTGLQAEGEAAKDPATLQRTGLADPKSKLSFFDAEGKKLGALLVGAEDGEDVYAMAEGGDRIVRIPKTKAAELPRAPSDLLAKPTTAAAP